MLPEDSDVLSVTLEYIVTHVFCPLRLPDGDDYTVRNDSSLTEAVCAAACAYTEHISSANVPQWNKITRMLENLHAAIQFERLEHHRVMSQLSGMRTGDILTFLIRAQNAGVIFRKQEHATLCESMEVSPKADAVMAARGKLICSYPGPAIEIPNDVFGDATFTSELANFLFHMHEDVLDVAATTHPRYTTELLTGILRAVGLPAEIDRISKRVGDDVVGNNSSSPWRRSSLWLLIKVVLQTSLERSALGLDSYKEFMLFFACNLAEKVIDTDLPNDILHCISTKIGRRLAKLGSSAPEWLSSTALQICDRVRSVLENRWKDVQDAQRASPSWDPSHLDIVQDSRLSLLDSRDYIRNSLSNHLPHPTNTPFQPNHHPRGTLDDFLDADRTFFEEAYRADPYVTLYDVEQAVEQGIDAWVTRVADVDEACVELEILANKYSSRAKRTYANHPEHLSIMLLTMIELWIALDKLSVTAIPMLAEYTPEVPISLLEGLLVRTSATVHRLRCACVYLSGRHASSHHGSIFSESVSTHTFAVRYYAKSSRHQALKARIEEAAEHEVELKVAELEQANALHIELRQVAANAEHEFAVDDDGDEYNEARCYKCQLEKRIRKMQIEVHMWPLPTEPLRAAVIVFELDPPLPFNMWRSATFHLLLDHCPPSLTSKSLSVLLHEYRALHPYFVKHPRSFVSLGLYATPIVEVQPIPAQQDEVCLRNDLQFHTCDTRSRTPILHALGSAGIKRSCTYELHIGPYHNLQRYLDGTSHTSNEHIG